MSNFTADQQVRRSLGENLGGQSCRRCFYEIRRAFVSLEQCLDFNPQARIDLADPVEKSGSTFGSLCQNRMKNFLNGLQPGGSHLQSRHR
ncbi:MAG: hypothetical protein M3Q46_04125 [Verrucomicrobiota bacterium]|nr:hypothetical protein [Verrucomicrobiota bacterium]